MTFRLRTRARTALPRSGFTLLELLLTVALTSLALGMATQVAIRSSRIWGARQEGTAAARSAWSLAHRLSRELRMALPPDQFGPEAAFVGEAGVSHAYHDLPGGEAEGAFAPEMLAVAFGDDRIRFAAWAFGEEPTPISVEYSILRDEEGGSLGVARRSAPLGSPLEEADAVLVARQVVSLEFEYLDAQGLWQREWSDAKSLPRAVRVRAGALRPNGGPLPELMDFSTTVYLPVGTKVAP